MDTAVYTQLKSVATDTAKTVVTGQMDLLETVAQSVQDTPVQPFFDVATTFHRTTLETFLSVADGAATEKPVAAPKKTAAKQAKAEAKTDPAPQKKPVEAPDASAVVDVPDATVLYDDLTEVMGIGPATMKKLHLAGVRTMQDLAEISAKDLGAIIENANVRMLKYTPADWIANAKTLAKSAKAA